MLARMSRLLLISAVLLTGCVAGRSGVQDSDGNSVGIDASLRRPDAGGGGPNDRRDGSVGQDGSPGGEDDGGGWWGWPDGSPGWPDGSTPPHEVFCGDGHDDDGDGLTDCEDPDCVDAPCGNGLICIDGSCGGCRGESVETNCGDGADEDCDGLVDCADPDCAGLVCGADGSVCTAEGTCPCAGGLTKERLCYDGVDDDCDGLVDCADPDCDGKSCGDMGLMCIEGECTCTPSIEFCNDRDENCDGVIDDGCPADLSFCCPTTLGPFGPIGSFEAACPAKTVLMGLAGRTSGARLTSIQPICAEIFMTVELDVPENRYPVFRDEPVLGTRYGGTTGTAFDDRCPGEDVVIGVRVSVDDAGILTGISLQCGTVSVEREGLEWHAVITPSVQLPMRGGFRTSSAATCDRGVISGVSGQTSGHLSGLAFTCSRLDLQRL